MHQNKPSTNEPGNRKCYRDLVSPGDRVTIRTRLDQQRTGRATIVCRDHAVLNCGGGHGTPVIADAFNTIKVTRAGHKLPVYESL